MNKSTLRERVSVTVRGYDILKEYCPGPCLRAKQRLR